MKMKRLRVSRRRLSNHMAALRGQGQKFDNIPESGLHPSFWESWEDFPDDCLLKPWRMWNLPCDLLLQAITNWVEGEPHYCDPCREFSRPCFPVNIKLGHGSQVFNTLAMGYAFPNKTSDLLAWPNTRLQVIQTKPSISFKITKLNWVTAVTLYDMWFYCPKKGHLAALQPVLGVTRYLVIQLNYLFTEKVK